MATFLYEEIQVHRSVSDQYYRSMFRTCLSEQYEERGASLVCQQIEIVEMEAEYMEVLAQYAQVYSKVRQKNLGSNQY